jgi:hypothetical protein
MIIGRSFPEDIAAASVTLKINFFLIFLRWDFRYCGHYWPIVPASGDSEDDCGEADGL